MYDVPGLGGARLQALDDTGIAALRDKADVLAVGLVGNRQRQALGQAAYFLFAVAAEREAKPVELAPRGGEKKVALVTLGVARAVQLRATGALPELDVV